MLGFGFTLLAISFFLTILSSSAAIQLIIVLNLAVTLFLSMSLWRHVPVKLWLTFATGAVAGFPIGMWIFGLASLDNLKLVVGVIIVALAFVMWFDVSIFPSSFKRHDVRSKAWPAGIGAAAGFMTTALGMPGPLLILYLSSIGLEKDTIRATAMAFFVFAHGVALLFHVTLFQVEQDILLVAGLLVPVAVVGAWGGHLLSNRVSHRSFRHAVLVLITASGVFAVVSVVN